MKIQLISILLGLIAFTGNANERFKKGDTLYVWAIEGVSIRTKPEGQIIQKLNYGTPVVSLQDDQSESFPIEVISSRKINGKEHPSVSIYGKFIEVKFSNTSGFVFDAYLSKLPPIKILNNHGDCEPYDEYFSREFGILKELKKELQPDHVDLRVLYNNGISYELQTTACCGSQTIIFPDMAMTEAFVFLNRVYNFERDIKTGVESKYEFLKVTENRNNGDEQYLQLDYELITIRIWRIKNYLIITRAGGD